MKKLVALLLCLSLLTLSACGAKPADTRPAETAAVTPASTESVTPDENGDVTLTFDEQPVNTVESSLDKPAASLVRIVSGGKTVYEREGEEQSLFCAFKTVLTDSLTVHIETSAMVKSVTPSHQTSDNREFRVTAYAVAESLLADGVLTENSFDVVTDVILFGCLDFDENGELAVDAPLLETALERGRDLLQVRTEAEREVVDVLHERFVCLLGRLLKARRELLHACHELRLHGYGALGGDGRRAGAEVRNVIAEGRIGLVSHGADHGNARRGDGPHDRFLVEGPEVFHRPAAASDDQHVGHPRARVEELDAAHDLGHGALALHLHGEEPYLKVGEAAREDGTHVVDHRAGGRRDDGDPMREKRQRPPEFGMVELVESLGLQLRLLRVERRHLVALPGDAQTLHLEGVLSARHVEV